MMSVFLKRVIAYFMDFFVVSAFMWIVSYLLSLVLSVNNPIYHYFIYVVPVLIMVYFVVCEKFAGSSVGKSLMYLQVISQNGAPISWSQAIVRNLTKIYWIPIIFDWAIGKILKEDRFFNVISKTVVIGA
ncbi:MAG: RDD family protein [Methanobrevibacter sp.]|uniref:RDD family protein n=1 Tax=Methanobrevibacter sp. TaxID=66852 RepID=UPI003F127D57